MSVRRFAWELLRLIMRGQGRRRLYFVPMPADAALRERLYRHLDGAEWVARSVTAPDGDRFAVAVLYAEPGGRPDLYG
ncbi:hypothetical protein [Dactylosporangium sp. NPDC051484]|uniref:hypothetical protein n=1 Tax=Dactylosporangium sp. NPDC051484 TaxID=3154942 RepID=UPI003450E2BA